MAKVMQIAFQFEVKSTFLGVLVCRAESTWVQASQLGLGQVNWAKSTWTWPHKEISDIYNKNTTITSRHAQLTFNSPSDVLLRGVGPVLVDHGSMLLPPVAA